MSEKKNRYRFIKGQYVLIVDEPKVKKESKKSKFKTEENAATDSE